MSEEERKGRGKLFDKKAEDNVKIALELLFLAYLIISFFVVLRIVNDETCGREEYTSYKFGSVTNSGSSLDSVNGSLLIGNAYDRSKNIIEWRLCFSVNSTSSNRLSVIDDKGDVLGSGFVSSGFANYCFNFVPTDLKFNNIGLLCDSCNSSNSVTFFEESLGTVERRVIEENGVISIVDDKSLDWVVYGFPSCWERLKLWSYWFISGFIFFIIVIFIIKGGNKMKEVFFND
jgi:hypothetical protein